MGIINVYNGIGKDYKTIKANGKIKDILPNLSKNNLILKKGSRVDAEYEVQPDDVLFIRSIPGDPLTMTLVLSGVFVAAGLGIGAAGISLELKKANKSVKDAQEKAQRDAENLAQQIDTLPFLKGSKNKSALGNSIQYTIGGAYNTPYLLTNGFYSLGGEYGSELFWNANLSLGAGDQELHEVLVGDESLIKYNPINSGVHKATGTQPLNNDSIYFDSRNELELRAPGESFTSEYFNKKVICTVDGEEIVHEYGEEAEPLIRQVSDYTKRLEVCIKFDGLREYDTTLSTWVERKATVRPYWSNDNGATWHEFYFDGMQDNSITLNTKKTVRFKAVKDFTASEVYGKSILLKLVKDTPKAESNTNETAVLLYYQSFCYDNAKSSTASLVSCQTVEDINTTRLGLRLVANKNTNDILDETHVKGSGLARTWNGSTWSTTKTATNNPAAWVLEILTSSAHIHSQYDDDELDLDSFGAFYEYCQTNEFECRGVLTSPLKKETLLSDILASCNATLFKNKLGLLEISFDKVEETAVCLLNSQDVKNITYTKSLGRKPDGAKVTYINSESWQVETIYVMKNGKTRTADSLLVEMNFNYVTTNKHAVKLARRRLAQSELQPRTIKATIGREGDFYPLYSKVLLQLEQFRQGLRSSYIKSITTNTEGKITKIKIADSVQFVSSYRYGVIIQAQNEIGTRLIYAEVTGQGDTRELIFITPFEPGTVSPTVLNNLSFGLLNEDGSFNKVTNQMKIYGITPDNSDGYLLELKDYNAEIYNEGTIPEYKSNLTEPPRAPHTSTPKADDIIPTSDNPIYRGLVYSLDDFPNPPKKSNFVLIGAEELAGYDKGYLYNYNGTTWEKVSDRNDYRYILAANDLGTIGESLPPGIGNAIAETQPKYLGGYSVDPSASTPGDTYCYIGDTTETRTKATVYKWDGITWNALDPSKTENSGYYMQALSDVLSTGAADLGTFSKLFADIFYGNQAILDSLMTRELKIKNSGYIESENYSTSGGLEGFRLDAEGNIYANKGYFRGEIGEKSYLTYRKKETAEKIGYLQYYDYYFNFTNNKKNNYISEIDVYFDNSTEEKKELMFIGHFSVRNSLSKQIRYNLGGEYWYIEDNIYINGSFNNNYNSIIKYININSYTSQEYIPPTETEIGQDIRYTMPDFIINTSESDLTGKLLIIQTERGE